VVKAAANGGPILFENVSIEPVESILKKNLAAYGKYHY